MDFTRKPADVNLKYKEIVGVLNIWLAENDCIVKTAYDNGKVELEGGFEIEVYYPGERPKILDWEFHIGPTSCCECDFEVVSISDPKCFERLKELVMFYKKHGHRCWQKR